MSTEFHRINAVIRFNTVYVCVACGKRQVGDTTRVELWAGSAERLGQLVDSIEQRSNQMPVGWSFDGQYNCGCAR